MNAIVWCMLLVASVTAKKSYEGYHSVDVTPTNSGQVQFLRTLLENPEIDFLKEPGRVGVPVRVLVPPQLVTPLSEELSSNGLSLSVVDVNFQNLIDEEAAAIAKARPGFDYDNFNDFAEIELELVRLVADCPVELNCEVQSIGTSHESRNLNLLKISKNGINRRAYWVDSLTHSREWLSGATLMKVADRLIRGRDCPDPDCSRSRQLTDDYDWYILPVVNPDGYVYSWTTDRMWRKNRKLHETTCDGVDINRNYAYKWGTGGSSALPCTQTYKGDAAASEPETQHMQAAADLYGPSLNAWLTIHTYGQIWLSPFGNTQDLNSNCAYPMDNADILRVSGVTVAAIEDTFNTAWTYGSVCDLMGEASGGSIDYYYGTAGVKYSYGPELRGTDFIVLPDQIQPSFDEFWNGLVAMVYEIAANP